MKILLIKIPCALIIGCLVALSLTQNDPWLKQRIERLIISSTSDIVGERLQVKVTDVDLLRGVLEVEDVAISSSSGDWSFRAPRLFFNVSWMSWFKGKRFTTWLAFEQPSITTHYAQGKFAAEEPLYALINAPLTLPIVLSECTLKSALVTVIAQQGKVQTQCSIRSHVGEKATTTKAWCTDGSVYQGKELFARHLAGTFVFVVPYTETPSSLTLKLSCTRPEGSGSSQDVPYQFFYRNAHQRATCRWRAENGSCVLYADDIKVSPEGVTSSVSVAGQLGELASYVTTNTLAKNLSGMGSFEGTVSMHNEGYAYDGTAHVEQLTLAGVVVPTAALKVQGSDTNLKAQGIEAESSGMALRGDFSAQFLAGTLIGSLALARPYEGIPRCPIKKGRTQFTYADGKLQATFDAEALFQGVTPVPFRGSLRTNFRSVEVNGTCAGNPVTFSLGLDPFALHQITVRDPLKNKRLVLSLHEQARSGVHAHDLTGTIDGAFIKIFLELLTGYKLAGSLEAKVRTTHTNRGKRIHLMVHDASLKIPGTYTVIKDLSCSIDLSLAERSIKVNDLKIGLHKGSAWSPQVTVYFTREGSLKFAHIPLQCRGLLISKHKELFGTLSGGLTTRYSDGAWRCEGLVAIENAHLRSNLLSSEVQRGLLSATGSALLLPEIELAVRVQSHSPLKVQTSFLTTDAQCDVTIGGTAQNPQVTGEIELLNGILHFPYKPLFVTSGKLTLAPSQPDGPTVDLIAKNKIRAYSVTLRATGPVAEPTIVFEASPPLSEEAIVTLLLAGSDQGSIAAAVPRVLMQQIEDVLFASGEKLSRAQQFLKSLLTPLKNVRLVKKDTAQEELQAVVEVDINDRLRAKAQNNLQLSDETQLELEYSVSDDVTVKAVRDKAGSLGGEVEMRWKF